MKLIMRTTIACVVATGLALFVFTPTIAKASGDAAFATAVLVAAQVEQTGDLGTWGDGAKDQAGEQGQSGDLSSSGDGAEEQGGEQSQSGQSGE
jgi:hypothetical protein